MSAVEARKREEKRFNDLTRENTPEAITVSTTPPIAKDSERDKGIKKDIGIKSIIAQREPIEEYIKNSATISDYFFHMDNNHKSFALMLGKLVMDKRHQNLESLLSKIEKRKTMSPDEVSNEITNAMIGIEGSETYTLLSAIKSLYVSNNQVYESLKEQSIQQNDVCNLIADKDAMLMVGKEAAQNVLFELGVKKKDSKYLSRAEEVLENMEFALSSSNLSSSSRALKFVDLQREKDPERTNSMSDIDIVQDAVNKIKFLVDEKKLRDAHEEASLNARIFTIKAIQSENEDMLKDVFYLKGQDVEQTKANMEIMKSRISKSISKIKASNPSRAYIYSADVVNEIMEEIGNKFIAPKEQKYIDTIDRLDSQINSTHESTGIGADMRQEEIFIRMVEDTIYNVFMRRKDINGNSGVDTYNSLAQNLNKQFGANIETKQSDIVDVVENVTQSKYTTPLSDQEAYINAQKALALFNIRTIAKAVSEGTATKEEAKEAMKKNFIGTNLTNEEQRVLSEEILSKFNNKDFSRSFEPEEMKNIQQNTGDLLAQYGAKQTYAQIYDTPFSKALNKVGLFSKDSVELQSCIKSASNPKIRTHSVASDVSSCFDKFKEKLKGEIQTLNKESANPAVALCGISILMLLAAESKAAMMMDTTRLMLEMEEERIKAMAFLEQAENVKDAVVRSEVLKTEKFNATERVIAKPELDEWIFRQIKGKHDLQLNTNEDLHAESKKINTSSSAFERIESLQKSISKLSDSIDEMKSGGEPKPDFRRDITKVIEKDIEKTKNLIVKDLEGIKESMSQAKNYDLDISKAVQKATQLQKKIFDSFNEGSSGYDFTLAKSAQIVEIINDANIVVRNRIESKTDEIGEVTQRLDSLDSNDYANRDIELANLKSLKSSLEVLQHQMTEIKKASTSLSAEASSFGLMKSRDDEFSRSVAFSNKPTDIDEKLKRYSSTEFSQTAVAQDLMAVEHLLASPSYSMQQKKELEKMKVLLREHFIAVEFANPKNKMSRDEILLSLYDNHKTQMVSSSELDFTLIQQEDPSKTQVITKEKYGKNNLNREADTKMREALKSIKKKHIDSNPFESQYMPFIDDAKKESAAEKEQNYAKAISTLYSMGIQASSFEYQDKSNKDKILAGTITENMRLKSEREDFREFKYKI